MIEGTGEDEGPVVPDAATIVGRLTRIPAQRSKQRVVLDRLAQDFEVGVHYSEREVNALLRRYHDDVAALRRHLVDEGFLDRAAGEYWRAGGTT